MRVGFIGAGLMGHGVAKNILEKGYALTLVGHRNREPVEDLVSRGAVEVADAATLAAGSDVLLTCLPNSAVLEQVAFGPGGIVDGAEQGLVLLDLTTGAPSMTRALGAKLAERGINLLDAPMTLTPKEAEAGRLNLLVGGEEALYRAHLPLLRTFSERVFYTGPLGSAHTLKLINNFLSQGNVALVVTAIVTALRAGVDPHQMREVISISGGNSTAFQRLSARVTGEAVGGGGAFAIKNAFKDVRYFADLTKEHGLHAPLAGAVEDYFALAVALGYGEAMLPALFDLQEQLGGGPSV